MHVLVTGASGFIGRHLTHALLDRGDAVTGADRRAGSPDHVQLDTYTHISGDLTDVSYRWRREAARADAVVHLAARPGVRATGATVEAQRARDILGTTEAVLAATPARTPLVVVSSSAVYGSARPDRPSHESDALRPVGSYGRWKAMVETRCADRAAAGGLVSIARPFTVAGPDQRPDMAMSTWLCAAMRDQPITVFGHLDRSRDVTDVRDVVAGLLALVDAGVGLGVAATVNLGAGRPRTHREVLAALARVTGHELTTRLGLAHCDDVAHTWADTRRFADLIGRTPDHDLDALLTRQVQSQRIPLAV